MPAPIIFGLEGPVLLAEERRFFREADPLGFILFGRNCHSRDQIARLTQSLRETTGRADTPILIDQEGGRVQRLGPPHWPQWPAAARFGQWAMKDPEEATRAVHAEARMIAEDLHALGLNVDCAPVLDLARKDADPVIGDRAYGSDPALVARLGQAFCEGLIEGGVLPVLKHIPGHGRARVDSHLGLPQVETALRDLEASDFVPFRMLGESLRPPSAPIPWAMTAHILYTAIDPDRPATLSHRVIDTVIRDLLGQEGLLITDDLSMKALSGTLDSLASTALAAGCDVVLHCNGRLEEMRMVASGSGTGLKPCTAERLNGSLGVLPRPAPIDPERRAAECAWIAGRLEADR